MQLIPDKCLLEPENAPLAETSHRQMDIKWHMLSFRPVPVYAYYAQLGHTNIHSCASIKDILDNSSNANKAFPKSKHSEKNYKKWTWNQILLSLR